MLNKTASFSGIIQNEEEFLSVCERTDILLEKKEPEGENNRFSRQILDELFRDIHFFYNRYKSEYQTHRDRTKIQNIKERLMCLLDAFAEELSDFTANFEYLEERLGDSSNETAESTVFIYASIKNNPAQTEWIDIILKKLTGSSPDSYGPYIRALKFSFHPGIDEKVQLLKNISDNPLKSACQSILDFRIVHRTLL